MLVTICGPNLNDQSKGSFHVHAHDCGDLAKHARREPEYRNGWTIEAYDCRAAVEAVYEDHMAEGENDYESYRSDLYFFPCVNLPE